MLLPYYLCGVLIIITAALVIKIVFLRRDYDEIRGRLEEHLSIDTNTLIQSSSNDKHVKRFAALLNKLLRALREQRQKYLNGELELNEAVTNISHDLRTPLTAILGYLELLEGEELSEPVKRYAGIIKNRAQALEQLTDELFRYSVIISERSAEIEDTVINDVLEEAIAASYASLYERRITPDIQIPEHKVIRRLNRSELSRVFQNLLSNAVKYSGGDLDIILTGEGEITFANTAPALDEVRVGKLFDRFYTVESGHKSAGLGLSIARTLVERMGGTIEAKYANGKLSIRILLPE